MGETTGIDYVDATWNPWYGCKKKSEGCLHCYAERQMLFYGKDFNTVKRAKDGTFYAPDRWGDPKWVLTCSWSDFFIADADWFRQDAWAVIKRNPRHFFLVLTKRPENIADRLPPDWGDGYPNAGLGISASTQERLNERAPILANIPAVLHFLSAEPLIEPISVYNHLDHRRVEDQSPLAKLQWVIVGGESGVGTEWRDMKIPWVDKIYSDCRASHTPMWFKQWAGQKSKMQKPALYKGRIVHERPNFSPMKQLGLGI